MKTAEEWRAELEMDARKVLRASVAPEQMDELTRSFIRAVQTDALESAAAICDERRKTYGPTSIYSAGICAEDCAADIRALEPKETK